MRLFILALLLPTSVFAQFSFDVQHYKFQIRLNDTNDTIEGRADILIRFTEVVNSVDLNLVLVQPDGRGMHVINAFSPISNSVLPIQKENKIRFQLARPARKDDTTTLTVIYKGVPADGLIISKTKYGRRSFFADNWPDRGQNWLPCQDHPADKATVEFLVTAPQHYQVVSNGVQIEETNLPGDKKITHWKEIVPISTKVMVIGVADFAVHLSGMINDCIPVYSWVYPENRENGFSDYAIAGEVLTYYMNTIGPYPYKKLANVQSKTRFGGLENANTIFYSEGSVTGTGRSESLIAHEIAHQWFGNHATEKTFAHLWLSEGFATYMTILYFENKYGKDTATAMLKEDRDEVISHARTSSKPVVDSTERDYMALLNPNSYEKGGWVLHMLRNQMGEEPFRKAIQNYYSQYGGTVAGTEELRKVFEDVYKKDLTLFFKQWLYTPGIPRLKITWKFLSEKKTLAVTVEQVQPVTFMFPLELAIPGSNQKPFTLQVTKKSETFLLPLTTAPSKLIPDPNTVLLFEEVK